MECPNCGAQVPQDEPHCRKCGSVIEHTPPPPPVQPMGGPGPVNVVIQVGPQTGAQGAAPQTIGPPTKSKLVAGILGIVLGFLGVHRFYLESVGIGLLLLFITVFTCGYGMLITLPWGVIEGILILVGTIDRDGQGRLLKP